MLCLYRAHHIKFLASGPVPHVHCSRGKKLQAVCSYQNLVPSTADFGMQSGLEMGAHRMGFAPFAQTGTTIFPVNLIEIYFQD